MNKRSLGALVALNLVLLFGVLVVSLTPGPAGAQGFKGRGGNYFMIAGQVEGLPQQAGIYILNLDAGELYWLLYNSDNDRLEPVSARDVATDLKEAQQQR